MTEEELNRIREWFDTVQDIHPTYLQEKDYMLAKEIYKKLGIRVPDSIMDFLREREKGEGDGRQKHSTP